MTRVDLVAMRIQDKQDKRSRKGHIYMKEASIYEEDTGKGNNNSRPTNISLAHLIVSVPLCECHLWSFYVASITVFSSHRQLEGDSAALLSFKLVPHPMMIIVY